MARSKQHQALARIASAWGVSEEVAKTRIEALPHSRVRDRYRAAETRVSRELGIDSIYAPQSKRSKSVQTNVRPAPSSWNWTPVRVETRVQPQHDYQPKRRVSAEAAVEGFVKERYQQFRSGAVKAGEMAIANAQRLYEQGKITNEQRVQMQGRIRGQIPPDLVEAVENANIPIETKKRYMKDMERFDAIVIGDMADPKEKGMKSWRVVDGKLYNIYSDTISSEAREERNMQVQAMREEIANSKYGMSWDELPSNIKYVLENKYDLSLVSQRLSAGTAYSAATGFYELTDTEYMKRYVESMKNSEFSKETIDDVVSNIEKIIEKAPGALRDILKRQDDAAKIDYLYRDSTTGTPYHDSFSVREENLKSYWSARYKEVIGE